MALIIKRGIHSSGPRCGPNPFFHLQALSRSRETARAAQLSKLPRTAHSTQLQMLQAEASVAPLPCDKQSKRAKDLKDFKTAVNLAKAEAPKASPPPVRQALDQQPQTVPSVALPKAVDSGVVKEIQTLRQELGDWQASVDDRLALLSYDLKRANSSQGSSAWLVAFGALFFICSWGLVTFAAEKKIQKATEAAASRPRNTKPVSKPPQKPPQPQSLNKAKESFKASPKSEAGQTALSESPSVKRNRPSSWFW